MYKGNKSFKDYIRVEQLGVRVAPRLSLPFEMF